MSWFNKLERRLEPFALSNLTLYIVAAQAFAYLGAMFQLVDLTRWMLMPALVFHGEWWRLITFMFVPPPAHWVFIAFALYFLYFTGGALESHLGTVKYNLFLFCGYLLTVASAFLLPYFPTTNYFVLGTIFLAFAYLHPDFQLLLFFILPVKVRWIALITWVTYAYYFATGSWSLRLAIGAAVVNFLLFFGRDMVLDLKMGQRRRKTNAARAAAAAAAENEPRHRCYICGKTDLSHPQMDFRYCSKCSGDQCYCEEHIRNHEHVVTPVEESK